MVIGPEALFPDLPGPVGVVMEAGSGGEIAVWRASLCGNLYDRVSGNQVESAGTGQLPAPTNISEMVACSPMRLDGLLVEACHFDFAEVAPAISAFGPASGFVIRDSEFHMGDISFQDNTDIVVENCRFQGGQGGIQFHRSVGVVTNCEFTDFNSFCVGAIGGSEVYHIQQYIARRDVRTGHGTRGLGCRIQFPCVHGGLYLGW